MGLEVSAEVYRDGVVVDPTMSADPFLDQPPSTGRLGCAVCAAPTPLAAGDTVCAACLLRDPLRGSVSATQAGNGAGVGVGPPQFGPLLANPLFVAPLHHPHQSHQQHHQMQMEAALTATPNEAWDWSGGGRARVAGGGRRVADKTECRAVRDPASSPPVPH